MEKVSDSLNIQLVDQPLSLIVDENIKRVEQGGEFQIDFSQSVVNVNYPISYFDQKI